MLAIALPSREVTPAMLELYARRLEVHGLDPDLLEAAVTYLIDHGEFFPTIAAIRRTAKELSGGENLPSPSEAWGLVRAKQHRDYVGGDLIEQAFQDVTSRWQIENASAYELTQHRHAFTQRYGELLAQARMEDEMTPDIKRLVDRAKGRLAIGAPREPERLDSTTPTSPAKASPPLDPLPPPRPQLSAAEYRAQTQAWRAKCQAITDTHHPKAETYTAISEEERAKRLAAVRAALASEPKREPSGG